MFKVGRATVALCGDFALMSLSRIGTLSFEQRSTGRWRFIAHKTETLKGLLHVSLHRELTEEGAGA